MDLAEEGLYLGVESRAAEDDLFEAAAECSDEAVAYLLLYGLGQQRNVHHGAGAVGYRLELGLVDLFHDERHGDDDVGVYLLEGLHYDLGAGDAGKEVHVAAEYHFVYQFEHQAVHVGGGQHCNHFGSTGHLRFGIECEIDVGVEGTVRKHHAFGESGSAGGVVDKRKLLGTIFVVFDIRGFESVRILLVESLGDVVADSRQRFAAGVEIGEVVHKHHDLEPGHLGLGKTFPFGFPYEEDLGFGMVYEIVDIAGLEFVEDGHGNGSIGKSSQKAYSPVSLIA